MAIGWAVLGTGRVNKQMAPAMKAAKGSRLVAVLSRDKSRADAFAAEYGFERAYDSLDDLLGDPQVDAVYVASPNAVHAWQTNKAAEAGKHVLCEKPMAPTAAECRSMIDACRRHGVKLGVGFQYRQYPALQKAREIAVSGGLGRLIFADVEAELPLASFPNWYLEMGMAEAAILYLAGVHRIDLLRFVLGTEIEEVSAFIGGQTPERSVGEMLAVMMRFSNGALGMLHVGVNIPHGESRVRVNGSSGSLYGDNTSPWWGEYSPELLVKTDEVATKHQFPMTDAYKDEIEDFNLSITEGRAPRAAGVDGLRAADVSSAIVESVRQKKAMQIIS